jgi:hypothetical protein
VGEVWDIKDDLIEEDYANGVEYRNVNLRNDVLQVFANANKAIHPQSREAIAYQERWASEFSISARIRELKMNGERFGVGQREQARDHRLGEIYPECGIDLRVRRTVSCRQKKFGCNVTQELADVGLSA